MTIADSSFMMEARIPTRSWASYDLATAVARDDKKGVRGTTQHIEKDSETDGGRVRRFPSIDSDTA